ncbi:hypothetical protein JTE90_016088 [Oedothorax gibbosus]|uniref:Uncharacterized protein n=1 Tax=Oedothorax gibbosus TaxID=931172 RepID=A0AAV6TS41_9ARAC|nr:hypothetical protein JTE90_016088 [Oedothorax gibbosus]
MCEPLPIGHFGWLTQREIAEFDIYKTETDSEVGYILEVDLEYRASCTRHTTVCPWREHISQMRRNFSIDNRNKKSSARGERKAAVAVYINKGHAMSLEPRVS